MTSVATWRRRAGDAARFVVQAHVHPKPARTPLVSVVIATYNWSGVLRHAIGSVLGQTYRALRGDGAFMNDRRVRVSDVGKLSDALLCYSSLSWFTKAGREKTFLELANRTHRQRGFGDFYGFVLVAAGAADVMVEHGVHAWDVAATKAIIEEAGGRFTDWTGTPTIDTPDVLATNGLLHDPVRTILNG